MPTRIVLGDIALWKAVLSAAISIGATIGLIPVATRVYSRAVLRTGRVRIREVLRVEGADEKSLSSHGEARSSCAQSSLCHAVTAYRENK